jgi:hypothetical protein
MTSGFLLFSLSLPPAPHESAAAADACSRNKTYNGEGNATQKAAAAAWGATHRMRAAAVRPACRRR